jgi:hypothetical protein
VCTLVDILGGGVAVPSLLKASRHTLREAAVGAQAPTAETVTDEPGEGVVILGDLDELAVPSALPARVADAAPLGDAPGGHDVTTMAVRGEAPALAAVALRTGANTDLVQPVCLGAGGDDEPAAAPVGLEDLVGMKLEEAEAAEDVGRFGGGWVLHLRYSCVDHGGPSLWSGLRGYASW